MLQVFWYARYKCQTCFLPFDLPRVYYYNLRNEYEFKSQKDIVSTQFFLQFRRTIIAMRENKKYVIYFGEIDSIDKLFKLRRCEVLICKIRKNDLLFEIEEFQINQIWIITSKKNTFHRSCFENEFSGTVMVSR
jgi:hypothetical protein